MDTDSYMLGIFRKTKSYRSYFPRDERTEIEGDVYIKRPGREILRGCSGNISSNGLYVKFFNHDLEKGKKVEIILVKHKGPVKQITRMMGIVIRIDDSGAAMVTYKHKEVTDLASDEALG